MDNLQPLHVDSDGSETDAKEQSSSPPTSPSRPNTPFAFPRIEDVDFSGLRTPTPIDWVKPTLDDFVYQGTQFPAVPPAITGSSSSLDRTIDLVSTLLDSTTNDLALFFMMSHREIIRLFEPRHTWDFASCRTVPVSYQIRGEDSGSAMAWYLFDQGTAAEPGTRGGHCYSCEDMDGLGPFRECFVPQVAEAMGACTNCLFVGEGARCSRRLRAEGVGFTGFTDEMVEGAPPELLEYWLRCIRAEIAQRELDAEMAGRASNSAANS